MRQNGHAKLKVIKCLNGQWKPRLLLIAPQLQITMRPGQITPNDFEVAILERMAERIPSIQPLIAQLHVISREFTCVDSHTTFDCQKSAPDLGDQSRMKV